MYHLRSRVEEGEEEKLKNGTFKIDPEMRKLLDKLSSRTRRLIERLIELEDERKKVEFELRTEEMRRDLDPLSPEEFEMLRRLKRSLKRN